MRLPLLLLLLASSLSATAQEAPPDSLDGAQFFPLAVGNEWQYTERRYNGLGGVEEEWTEAWRVTDSVRTIAAGTGIEQVYYVLRVCRQFEEDAPYCEAWDRVLRFDEQSSSIVSLDDTMTEVRWQPVPCPLGDGPYEDDPLEGNTCFPEEAILTEPDTETQIGTDVIEGRIARTYVTLASAATLVEGIGLVSAGFGDPNPAADLSLRFARLDGVEYGSRGFSIPNSSAPSPDSTPLTALLGPNPTTGPLSLLVSAPSPVPVRATAFDLLGRRVAEVEGTTGSRPLALDLSGSAPGLYVVRVEADGSVLTLRATVAR